MRLCTVVLFAALLPACSPARPELTVGQEVNVQFRRDALGGAASLPVPPTVDEINDAKVSLSGELVRLDPEWVVLEVPLTRTVHWIDRDSVLLIQTRRPRKR